MKPLFKSLPTCSSSCVASRQAACIFFTAITVMLSGQQARAAAKTWDGGGGDANWLTGANWIADTAPSAVGGDNLIFTGTVRAVTNNDFTAGSVFTGLSFTNTVPGTGNIGVFTLAGNGITLGGNVTTTAATAAITDIISLPVSFSATRTITTGTNHSLTVSGSISESAAGFGLIKQGAATLFLQGANTLTGSVQHNEGTLNISGLNGSINTSSGVTINGTFTLANTSATNNSNRLNDSGTVTLNGGILNFNNTAATATNFSETTGAVTIAGGASTIGSANQASVGQTSALTIASLARTATATVNFTGASLGVDARNQILITANPTLTNNLIGGWATVSGANWASYDATNGVTSLPAASYTNDAWDTLNHTTVTTSSAPATDSTTHSLRFNLPAANTVTLAGTNTINGGGILVALAVGAFPTTITGGSLQGPAGGDLFIHQNNNTAASGFTISSVIQDNTSPTNLIKAGGGILTLTAANTFTGSTTVTGGNVTLANPAGETLKGNIALAGSGRIVLGAANQISDTSVLTFISGANSARFLPSGFNDTIGGIQDAAGTFTGSRIVEAASDGVSNAAATLTINTALGQTYNFGGLVRNAAGTLTTPGSSNLSITKEGAGTQTFSGSVTYSGPTQINAGTLQAGSATAFGSNSAVTLADAAGATLSLVTFSNSIGSLAGGGASGGNVSLGTATLSAGGNNTNTTYAGTFTGTGGLTKTGTGTLTLSGLVDHTGNTTITTGTIKVGSATTFVARAALNLAAGAIFDLNGFNARIANIAGSTATSSVTNTGAADATLGLGAPRAGATTNATAATGVFSDGPTNKLAITLTNANSPTYYFNTATANTFSGGLTLLTGTGNGTRLRISSLITTTGTPGAIASGPFGKGAITLGVDSLSRAGILIDTVADNTLVNDIVFNTALGNDNPGIRFDTTGNVLSGTITANASATFSTGVASAAGAATITGKITGAGGLALTPSANSTTLNNAFTLTLSNAPGTNDYAGDTTISKVSGTTTSTLYTLALGAADQIPNGSGKGNVTVDSTLNLAGFGDSINALNGAATGVVDGGSGTPLLTLGDNNASGSFAGVIRNTSGSLKLAKIGAGSQALNGANSYTGDTTITGGVLSLGSPSLADSSALTIGVDVNSPAVLNLPNAGTDTVGSLIIDGVTQPNGLYDLNNSGGAITGLGKIQVGASADPYSAWTTSFGLQNPWLGADPALNGNPTGDPDGDGIVNLLEFVLGGSPVASSTAILPTVATVGANLVLSYKRSDESESTTTQIGQWSTDLTTWNPITPVLVNENAGQPDDMTVSTPTSNAVDGKLFLRVNVVTP